MDNLEYRKALGKFATGVTVITTKSDERIHGMTANAFMSISLEPKLVTISIDNKAKMLDKIKKSGYYAVSFLSEEQIDISMHFAGQKPIEGEIEFDRLLDIPIIKDALGSVICEVSQTIEVGDHTLFVGKVLDMKVHDGQPLTFFGGKYGKHQPIEYIKS